MSEPAPEDVVPRDGVKVILGDNVQTDLLLLLHGQRRTLSASDIVAALDHHEPTAIRTEIEKFMRVNAIVSPTPGHYQLAYSAVGKPLHNLIEVTAAKTRDLHDLAPLPDCVSPPPDR